MSWRESWSIPRTSVIPVLSVILVVVVTTVLSVTSITVVKRQNDATQVLLAKIERTGAANTDTLQRLTGDVEQVLAKNRLTANQAHCALAHLLIRQPMTRSARALVKAIC